MLKLLGADDAAGRGPGHCHHPFSGRFRAGWVTDEDPMVFSLRKQRTQDFQPPLDIVDGAARVCDPFFHGILTGTHWYGKFLKDYFPVDW